MSICVKTVGKKAWVITAEDRKSARAIRDELETQGLYCTSIEKQSEVEHLPGDYHFLATCPSSPQATADVGPVLYQSVPAMTIV